MIHLLPVFIIIFCVSWNFRISTGAIMLGLVKSCIGTKFTSQFGDLIAVSSLISFQSNSLSSAFYFFTCNNALGWCFLAVIDKFCTLIQVHVLAYVLRFVLVWKSHSVSFRMIILLSQMLGICFAVLCV